MSLAPSTTPTPTEVRHGVTYDAYLRLRDDPGHAGRRMAYHDGVLEIMSPAIRHDWGVVWLSEIVKAYCEAFDLTYQSNRTATFHRGHPGEERGAGNEADESFFLGPDALAAVALPDPDLAAGRPPTLWLEVDHTTSSLPREPLYADLRIPEVWRYQTRDRTLAFRRLAGGVYEDVPASVALPGMTPELVLDALAGVAGRTEFAFRRWLREAWLPGHRQGLLAAGAGPDRARGAP